MLIALIIFLINGRPTNSQYYPPGTLTIDGFSVECHVIGSIVSTQIPGIAFFDSTGPAILLNPMYFFELPTQVKIFVYAHECGHSVIGANESAADCFAVKLGRDEGWLDHQGLQFSLQYLSTSIGDRWTGHLPGPLRVQNALQCFFQP